MTEPPTPPLRPAPPNTQQPPDEDLQQPPRFPSIRRSYVVLATAAAAGLAVVGVVLHRDDSPAPTPPTSVPSRIAATPTFSIPANPTSGPEQDAITVLNRCAGECVSYIMTATMLRRTGFAGLSPTFGIRVVGKRREQLRSITGRARGGQVRLLYERVRLPDAGLRVTDSKGPNRTVVLAVIRDGWRLTAVLIGATPPTAAAERWARSAPLPQ